MARGFRAVKHDYSRLFSHDQDTVTPPGPFAAPVHLHANGCMPASAVAFRQRKVNPHRILLIEYDDADVVEEHGGGIPWLFYGNDRLVEPVVRGDWTGDWVYKGDGPVPDDDRPFSSLWKTVSAGTVVDELDVHEIATLDIKSARKDLPAVQTLLAAHGWDDWEPARV